MSNENNVMKAFEDAIAGSQLRKFDFGSYEISDIEKQKVEEHEAKILNTFRKYKNNLFKHNRNRKNIKTFWKFYGLV